MGESRKALEHTLEPAARKVDVAYPKPLERPLTPRAFRQSPYFVSKIPTLRIASKVVVHVRERDIEFFEGRCLEESKDLEIPAQVQLDFVDSKDLEMREYEGPVGTGEGNRERV